MRMSVYVIGGLSITDDQVLDMIRADDHFIDFDLAFDCLEGGGGNVYEVVLEVEPIAVGMFRKAGKACE